MAQSHKVLGRARDQATHSETLTHSTAFGHVVGPGTADATIVPPARRAPVGNGENIVIVGGAVSGTWSVTGDEVVVGWFSELGSPPSAALAEEVAQLATIIDRPLELTIRIA